MKKETKQQLSLLVTISAIGLGGYALYRQHEKERPHRLLEQLKERLSTRGRCENAWINYTPHKTRHYGETHIGYDGGITIMEHDRPVYYEFFIDKKTGETIKLEQKMPPTE